MIEKMHEAHKEGKMGDHLQMLIFNHSSKH